MPDPVAAKTEVLNEREVSTEFGLSVPWLRKQRRLGKGPTYLKVGRMIRYFREDVRAYLIDHVVSTTEG
jgi:predicted DNA-binding transcriptional regulator AlpA